MTSGSGGTNNSRSSGGHHDNSSSSARFSSTSTLPSSTDLPLDENSYSNGKDSYDIQAPPIPEHHSALKAAGRAFSFGRKKAEVVSVPSPASRSQVEQAQPDTHGFSRPRAMTESSHASGSTATPPKFLGGDLDFDDGFGSMFESFGKRQSKVLDPPPVLGSVHMESPVNPTSRLFGILAKSSRKTCHQLIQRCQQSLILAKGN